MYKYLLRGRKDESARSFPLTVVVHTNRTRGNEQTKEHEIPSEHKRILFYCEDSRTLAQVAQGGCGDSILGDI